MTVTAATEPAPLRDVRSRVFHRSRAAHGTATVINKWNRLDDQQPLVVSRVGQSPDRSREAVLHDPQLLWDAVFEVLGIDRPRP